MTILVTGARGLVGSTLVRLLQQNCDVVPFDIRNASSQDIRNPFSLAGYRGIVHLAAVSRVVTGEEDPENCVHTNERALGGLYRSALAQATRPWIVFASSREVYGDAGPDPVNESAGFSPLNVYARSKVAGELLSMEAREAGLGVNIVRLSSVYGRIDDHADRVAPAFARTAACGGTIRMEGRHHVFDFTHVDDVARGLVALIEQTERGVALPPVHLVSGRGTSIAELAELSERSARAPVALMEATPRSYGVTRFVGDPGRASELLGWRTRIPIEQGMADLVADFAEADRSGEGGA